MNAVPFDTLRLAQALRGANFTPEQAEGAARAIADAAQTDLATKGDLHEVKAELKAEIASLRTDMTAESASVRGEFASVRADMAAEFSSVRAEIASGRAEWKIEAAGIRAEMRDMKAELLKWIIGAVGLQTIVIIGAIIGAVITLARLKP